MLNSRASRSILVLPRMSLGCLRELLVQKSTLESCHAVPKLEVGEVIEIKNVDEEAVVYGASPPVKRGGREQRAPLLSLSRYCPLSRLFRPFYLASASGSPVALDTTSRQLRGGFVSNVICAISIP